MKISKLITCAIMAGAIASCSSPKIPFKQYAYIVDYVAAGLDGKVFLTEANSVSFDYDPIGSLIVTEDPGYEIVSTEIKTKARQEFGDTYYSPNKVVYENITKNKYGDYKYATAQSALEYASRKALEMGGDGIICLSIMPEAEYDKSGKIIKRYVNVKGMVIKRK